MNNQTQKVSSNKKGKTSLNNKEQKKGTDKKQRRSMSSSRSNGDSKEKDLTETTQDENDMPYDSNEQMTIETKRVKETKIIPKKD